MPEPKLPAWHDVLRDAEQLVRQKPLWSKFIKGTPLENDAPVMMADFALRLLQRERAADAAELGDKLREAARNLMLYADECALILKATHPGKAASLGERVAAVGAALRAAAGVEHKPQAVRVLTADQVRDMLHEMAKELGNPRNGHGGQKPLAEHLGVSESFLSDVLNGRREPTEAILEPLGLERIVTYRRKAGAGIPVPPGECMAPACDCEPESGCIQRVPATFHRAAGVETSLENKNG